MLRSIRHLVNEARQHLTLGRISRHFNRFCQGAIRIPSFDARLPRTRCLNTKVSVSPQSNFGESKRSVGGNLNVNKRGENGASLSARTRRARCRLQVLHSSSSHLMIYQVVTILRQAGLKPYVVAEDRLTVTWPTETNLDHLETQEPLTVELQIHRDQGIKFRRISGPKSLFRWKLQDVLSLVYIQCGW
ncbi:hypothetical protein TcWFU_004618 [Taenia crassiceps]|uniref:Non-specific serine/threonine protein kinase n=1 Tax=Taenia crassiceps TaxID=6207 RepID=A0ABR4QDF4_9CEST